MTAIFPDFIQVPTGRAGIYTEIRMSKNFQTLAEMMGDGWRADGCDKAISPCGQITIARYPSRSGDLKFGAYYGTLFGYGATPQEACGRVVTDALRKLKSDTDALERVLGWARVVGP